MISLSRSMVKLGCQHLNHFLNPISSTLNLGRRVAQVAFYAISLGLVIYYISSKLSSRVHAIKLKSRQPKPRLGLSSSNPRQGLSRSESRSKLSSHTDSLVPKKALIDQEVMNFALQNIEDFSPYNFRNGNPDMPEVKEDLARLMTKFYQYEQDFLDLLKAKPIQHVPGRSIENAPELDDDSKNPWLDEKVIAVADNCMKIAYAISIKTFEELPNFIKEARTKGFSFENNVKVLTNEGTYQHMSYFYLPKMFHKLRGCLIVKQYPDGTTNFDRIRVEKDNKSHQKFFNKHIVKFYQSGTKQSRWRDLFNRYCEYVRAQVQGPDAFQEESRFVQWTQRVSDQIEWRRCRRTGKFLDSFFTPPR